MDCSIIYYISYKTGYIQRNLKKKFNTIPDIKVTSAVAAVSEEDLGEKFKQSLEQTNFIIIIGGLSAAGDRNVMTVLSDYFSNNEMEVSFNKKVINPDGGKDGYLIKSGDKYIAVLPDEPEEINKMFGSELLKNISITPNTAVELPEPVITHSIVFAPEPDDSLDRLNKKKRINILLTVFIVLGIMIALASAAWIYSIYYLS